LYKPPIFTGFFSLVGKGFVRKELLLVPPCLMIMADIIGTW